MVPFILWYLTITVLGLLTFPLAFRLFPALADRGYSLSRALGLLLWGFVFWLSATFGIVRNEVGGLLFTLLLVVGISAWSLFAGGNQPQGDGQKETGQDWSDLVSWLKANLRLVLSIETIFLIAFALWAFVRANNPETTGTEKPMEMAFINAILHSNSFPPHDPWLSGYGISYYYFGYVLAGMLGVFTAANGGTTFNLMLALVFALSVVGSYGLLYNLLAAYWGHTKNAEADFASMLGALFAPLILLINSNVEGFLELLKAYGIGWTNAGPNFWQWLQMKDLSDTPAVTLGWNPRFWFWWRASRILHDYDLRGNFVEVIDEFPFFSYLLGDLHPHVLAMPFGLLAAALALNLYLGGWQGETNIFGLKISVRKQGLALAAVVLGGLAFMNTWDFPIYLALVSGAFILSMVRQRGWSWELVEDFLKFSIPLALASIIVYLPFYLGFSSQAGGILPNIIFPTRGVYLWIMFGTLLVPIGLFLVFRPGIHGARWKTGLLISTGITLLLWGISVLLGFMAGMTNAGMEFIKSQGFSSSIDMLVPATLRRLQFGGSLLTLVLLIGTALAYLSAVASKPEPEQGVDQEPSPIPFVLMFILFGGLLVLAPEFIYLRDQFGSRMNTVFKFYYQAWTLWSIAAAFGVAVLVRELRGFKLGLFTTVMLAVMLVGITYPLLSLPARTDNFFAGSPERRTLDGAAYLAAYNPEDYVAIGWLGEAAPGIVAEAVGNSYSEYARVSTYSGQPAVLGWPNHESQWRGGYTVIGSRSDDIATLYTTNDWAVADDILKRYDIHYVYVGRLERTTYKVDERKFSTNLSEVYNQGQVVIYEVP
ncbi:MAG TPA: DUF2298 domain-containing protein [Anaerolineales bacterium]|jgi:YYY domain-containing protein